MAFSQQLLEAIANMQQVGQERLPVMPNNGNPGGANNMPQTQQPAAPQPAAPTGMDRYAWLKPSPAMSNLRALSQRVMAGQSAPAVQQPQPVAPIQTKPMQIGTPVLPQTGIQTKPMMIAPEPRQGFRRGLAEEGVVLPDNRNPRIRQLVR